MSPDVPKFRIGQTVYHVADEDPGVVIALVYGCDRIEYEVTWTSRVIERHTAVELSAERVYIGTGKRDDDTDRPSTPSHSGSRGPTRGATS